MRANAIDYLQKPVVANELQQAEKKLVKMHMLKSRSGAASLVNPSSHTDIEDKTDINKGGHRLCLPGMQGFTIIDIDDIVNLDADNNYTIFHLVNDKIITVSRPIKEYEETLDSSQFVRVHKSSIINLKYLREFSRSDGYNVIMSDGRAIPVSRRRMSEFLKILGAYN
jgi:two-component system, LytTR family, response regulator